ncbi:DUF5694 domain-containing protein [Oceanobacillus neutriphilus]|uniref:DUF5694 domain-containing protein n=1 Tax=Oceanobacillus neutriphilus TaxID=531815 RepID=UPI001E56DCAE|nr:DUF5694 domain-containing protein [Oceanobacillus neutriphilus]
MKEVVKQIAAFKPTKLALEVEKKNEEIINKNYQNYLSGFFNLKLNEIYQLGFRIAKEMQHKAVYCIDWMEKGAATKSIDEVYHWTKENQPVLFKDIFGYIEDEENNRQTKYETILEMYQHVNNKEFVKELHRSNLHIARIKQLTDYIGMEWLIWWYQRNLILFSNLESLATSADDRILFIVGSAHVEILNNFIEESGLFEIEFAQQYL